MSALTVFLTASIRPGDLRSTAVASAEARAEEYLATLRHLVDERSAGPRAFGIVFAENSGYRSEAIDAFCAANDVRYVAVPDGTVMAATRGKGAAEFALIDAAIGQLAPSADAGFLKLTGRLWLRNVADFVAASWPDVSTSLSKRGTFANSRTFLFRPTFLPFLRQEAARIDDRAGFFFEHALAAAVGAARAAGLTWRFLPLCPDLRGSSGTTGAVYGAHPADRARERVKHHLHRIMAR